LHFFHTYPIQAIWKAALPFLPPSYVPANPEHDLRWAIDCSYKAKPVHEEPSPNKLTRQIIYILTSYVYFFVPRKTHPYSPTPRCIRGVFLFRVPFESNLLNIFIFFLFRFHRSSWISLNNVLSLNNGQHDSFFTFKPISCSLTRFGLKYFVTKYGGNLSFYVLETLF